MRFEAEVDPDQQWICPLCDRVFTSVFAFDEHAAAHESDADFDDDFEDGDTP